MGVEGLIAFDYTILAEINGIVGKYPLLDNFFVVTAQYGPLVFDGYLVYLWFKGRTDAQLAENRKRAVCAAVSALLALGINLLVSMTWVRQRPYVTHPIHLLLPATPDPSFPSDHSAGGFSIATSITPGRSRAGYWLLLAAALVAFSRVYVGIHYPADVVGGAIIGIVSSLVVEHGKFLLALPTQWLFLLWRYIESAVPALKRLRFN